ncbi:DEAD-box ATP-dependent RNA helicase 3A, chloroplastic [Selaginella moellendorffii]|uniref:DEAD-box ATP-dependent RNA helicase 3A, chloroplastic n=1 Tax=Selaginella moellendorffii TaxID=88036 RepID=UPI000D1C61FE|nr:DEAD-box ATP-dependent RNA helicase 3A, chloroplastic [Selaginella moellendorffii]|eukprot:XP_024519673.1 DEAD-box ATP-dependent RNA helicase 3A, chloroplastic [Selaginella moellendorffii]
MALVAGAGASRAPALQVLGDGGGGGGGASRAAPCWLRASLLQQQHGYGSTRAPRLVTAAEEWKVSAVRTDFAPRKRVTTTWEDEQTDESEEEDGKILYVDDSELSQHSNSEEEEEEEDGVQGESKADDELAIAGLGVSQEIVGHLADRGITHLFPIQRAVFQPAMKGVDLIARAKTGTGKTLAFGIPIMDRIYRSRSKSQRRSFRGPAALVLAPTRELAKQVETEFMESGKELATVCVYGGVSIMSQKRLLSRGVDVAVGTPGRIIDLLEQGCLDLSQVECMVLDEADQMLAVGFEEDVEKIMEQLPEKRQNMLFSATMPGWVQKLSRKFLNKPLTIDLVGESDEKLAEGIKLYAVQTSQAAKRKILSDVITVYGKGGKTIVFTQTKRDAEEVSMAMNRTLGCEALHGDIAQFQREKTLAAFREGRFLILVATDVAARGLDITDVDLIIHYDLPRDSETFVHRSGRTGRAGKDGSALVFFSPQERRILKHFERQVGCSFQFKSMPHFDEVLAASSSQAVELIKGVHPDLKQVFMATAEKLLDEHGTAAFAAAIAHMSGFSQPPEQRSLISLEAGYMTLKFSRAPGNFPLAVRHVVGAIASLSEKAADNIGKVQMIDEKNVEGAVFDLPEHIATDLLSKSMPSGTRIEAIKELPSLQDSWDDGGRRSYGSSFGGDRGGGGRRPAFGRFDDSRGGGRYSSNGRSFSSSSRFGESRSSSSRSWGGGGGGGGNFDGACYKCGQSGHRAFECKQQRGGY